MGKRAVLYARAATDPSLSASYQIDACTRYSEQRGYTIARQLVDEVFGAGRRPGFDEVRLMVSQGDVDVVVCYSFDRLVRSPADLRMVRDEFPRGRANVECVHWDRRID